MLGRKQIPAFAIVVGGKLRLLADLLQLQEVGKKGKEGVTLRREDDISRGSDQLYSLTAPGKRKGERRKQILSGGREKLADGALSPFSRRAWKRGKRTFLSSLLYSLDRDMKSLSTFSYPRTESQRGKDPAIKEEESTL